MSTSAAYNTLLKFLSSDCLNVADYLAEDQLKQIAKDVIKGYKIDDKSRAHWLEINQCAMALSTGNELLASAVQKDFPMEKAAQVIYPLISNAVIQLASNLIMHLVRNERVAECVVLGKDEQRVIPNPGFNPTVLATLNQGNMQQGSIEPQKTPGTPGLQASNPYILEWKKAAKAKRVSDFLSYELLIESDSWLEDEHRLCNIVAAWGVGFKEIYYDEATNTNYSELIPPEDVIINNNHFGPLEKAPRITVRQYWTENDIIEQIRTGYFSQIDFELVNSNLMDNKVHENDSEELNPAIECIRQICWFDLDDDGYKEPYNITVAVASEQILGIRPAYVLKNIKLNPKTGQIKAIRPTVNIVDRHLISSSDGKFYSYGLNHLLLHQAKSITTILRNLIDAGTLKNAAASTGFFARSLKTREKTLQVTLGQYIPVDLDPGDTINNKIMNMPFQEPSQVLLQLLSFLVDTAKESGLISDLLTGQTEMQNVPATTMLATIEQGTRAFKPIVQKLYRSLKKEFKIWFNLYAEYLNIEKYVKFQNESFLITKDDFDNSLDISPVADPTMSSEAHRYARDQALIQMMQIPNAVNIPEAALRIYTDLQFENPEALVAIPPAAPLDPKLLDVQLKAQTLPKQQEIAELKAHTGLFKAYGDRQKVDIKHAELGLKAHQQNVNTSKTIVDAHKEAIDAVNEQNLTKIEAFNADTERQRVAILDRESRKPTGDGNH